MSVFLPNGHTLRRVTDVRHAKMQPQAVFTPPATSHIVSLFSLQARDWLFWDHRVRTTDDCGAKSLHVLF